MGGVVSKTCRTAFKDPVITLHGMTVKPSNLSIMLDIYNPNPFALEIHTLTYRVAKANNESVEIATGALTQKGLTVPSHSSRIAAASILVSLEGIGAASRSFIVKGRTDLVVRGILSIGGPKRSFLDFPYKLKGSVSLFGLKGSKSFESEASSAKSKSSAKGKIRRNSRRISYCSSDKDYPP